jgi:hypothetical protein
MEEKDYSQGLPTTTLVPPAMGLAIQGNNPARLRVPQAIGLVAGIAWRLTKLPLLVAGPVAASAGCALAG